MSTPGRDEDFRKHFPVLFGRAYQAAFRLLGDRRAAEDVAQEALLRAYVHWPRLDTRREGWVITTTVNIVIDDFRRERRRRMPRVGRPELRSPWLGNHPPNTERHLSRCTD